MTEPEDHDASGSSHDEPTEETFLSVPPCPFRRVSFGSAYCTISTDAYFAEVDPLTCLNCEVPDIISKPRCRFLSLGTELRPFRGEGKLVTAMACRELGIRIYNLNVCSQCSLYSEAPSIVDEIRYAREKAEIKLQVTDELVKEVAGIIRKEPEDMPVADVEEPPFRIYCWRFSDGHCRKAPVYTRGKTTVLLRRDPRNDEVFARAILPALKDLRLSVYRLGDEMDDAEQLCRACENIQESEFVIASLDDWSSNIIFLLGLVHGVGRRLAVLKRDNVAAVPLTEIIAHNIVEYSALPEIIFLLKHRFSPLVKHTQERGG
ncbi:MAG: hypothetical protein B1H03_00060 [Planctomycetales bacterium 4484_113]|nr:MAG: hypothetical protein B1H03_00060 [Planctomycetales bacterium 4484_113]